MAQPSDSEAGRGGPQRPGRRSIALLETATFLSGAGNGITMVALPWLILERTGSAAAAGVVAAGTAVPLVVVALLSGTVVDLVGRRRSAVVADLLSALSVLLIPLVDRLGLLTVPALVGLAVVGALFDPAGSTAREAMLPEAARSAGWTLDRANGVHEALFGTAYLVGPGLGGVLIAVLGPSAALVGTGVAFLLAAGCVVGLRGLPGSGRPARTADSEGFWRGTGIGVRFLLREPLLRPLTVLLMLVTALYFPVEAVVLPVYFQQAGRPEQLGLVLMVMSAGIVAGTLWYEWLVGRLSKRTLFIGCSVGACASLVWMALLPPLGWLLVAAALSGLLWGPIGPLINHAMQIRTPDPLRGRVTGAVTSAATAAGPAGYLAVGYAVQAYGVGPAFLSLSGALLAAVVALAPLRAWGLLDAAPVPGSAAHGHDLPRYADESSGGFARKRPEETEVTDR